MGYSYYSSFQSNRQSVASEFNEFSKAESERLKKQVLPEYDAGDEIQTLGDLTKKIKDFISKARKATSDEDAKEDLEGNVCFGLLENGETKQKYIIAEPYKSIFSGYRDEFVIFDSRVPIDYRENGHDPTKDQEFFYSETYYSAYYFSTDSARSGFDFSKVHIPNNLFAISDSVFEEIKASKKYILFDQINHSYTLYHPAVDGNDQYTIVSTKKDGTKIRSSFHSDGLDLSSWGKTQNMYVSFEIKPGKDSFRFIIDVDDFDMHKSRNSICTNGQSNDLLISESPYCNYWSSVEHADEALEKIPELKTKLDSLVSKIASELEYISSFHVCINNRRGFVIELAKNAKFGAISLLNSDDLDYLYKTAAEAITTKENDYFKIYEPGMTHYFFIRKDSLAQTNFSFEYVSGWQDQNKTKYLTIHYGKSKKLFTTSSQIEIDQIINAYQSVLDEQAFSDMYALALLKSDN